MKHKIPRHELSRNLHGYYDGYCYLPLYIFCGRHLLAAKLRRADIDAAAGVVEETARIVAPDPLQRGAASRTVNVHSAAVGGRNPVRTLLRSARS
jgi:hypothetical protein